MTKEYRTFVRKVMEEALPEIKDGVETRTVLRNEDLKLIRKGFVALIRREKVGGLVSCKISDGERACWLLKRILRKVK